MSLNTVVSLLASLLGILSCVKGQNFGNPCYGKYDGHVIEIGCWGHKRCTNGLPEIVYCPSGTVFARDSLTCVPIGTGNTECGKMIDLCTGKDQGYYPDEGCQSFYYCSGGSFVGRLYCPSNLVFHKEIGVCDWSWNVDPPCGTRRFYG